MTSGAGRRILAAWPAVGGTQAGLPERAGRAAVGWTATHRARVMALAILSATYRHRAESDQCGPPVRSTRGAQGRTYRKCSRQSIGLRALDRVLAAAHLQGRAYSCTVGRVRKTPRPTARVGYRRSDRGAASS